MKIIAIGDIHGRDEWKKIIKNHTFDKLIFIGDYFDSHESISPVAQIENFKEIIKYKRSNFNKVELLFGNHDFHYLKSSVGERYSGYQGVSSFNIQELLEEALKDELMKISYSFGNYLFTHAGVTKTWLKNTGYDGAKDGDIVYYLNELFKYKPLSFKFMMGSNGDYYGDDVTQGPIWVRPKSLLSDSIDGFKQVVGHTTQSNLMFIKDKIILIDCIGTSGEFLIIDNGKEITMKINDKEL